MSDQDAVSFRDIMFLTKKEAVEKYGSPSSQQKFILDDAQGEFRNGISDVFTEKERRSKSILIDEVTWEKDKDTWITIWYQVVKNRSTPKKSYSWKKGTEF